MTASWVRPPSELRIGRYVVESKLGEGGMAETWLCRLDGPEGASFSTHVVIKTMRPECSNPEFETMFADEARIGARLEHPNIPRILEFGQTPRGPFMVQEYVDGPSVVQILRRQSAIGVPNLRLGARIVADVAGALDAAWHSVDEHGHPLRVVHRDVSPSNILVSRRGTPKLIDFGVAMFDDRETQTEAGVLKGKLRYMAPEVLLHGDISHQTDLYSLGIVLYSLCVGETPWGTGGATATRYTEVSERAKGGFGPASARRPGLDPVLDAIIQRCLHVERAHRYARARDVEADLRAWLEANGGPCTDDEVAEQIARLFPGGPSDWRAEDVVRAASPPGSVPSLLDPTTVTARPSSIWTWVLAGVSTLLLLVVLALAGATAGLWFVLRPSLRAPVEVADAPAVVEVLDAAELALADEDLPLAAARIAEAKALPVTDPALSLRRTELEAEIALQTRILAVRALVEARDPLAAAEAQSLLADHPEHPDVRALAEQAVAQEPVPVAPEPPAGRARVRPAPEQDELLGERSERAPEAAPSVPPVPASDDGIRRR